MNPQRSTSPLRAVRTYWDDDAERGLLGAALTSRHAVDVVVGLGRDLFFRPEHREVHDVVVDLAADGRPVDPVTAAAELRRRGRVDDPKALVLDLVHDAAPTRTAAEEWASALADMHRRRRYESAAAVLAEAAKSGEDAATANVADLVADLVADGSTKARSTAVCVSDVAAEVVMWIWTRRIPRAKLTVLDGDPGLGKSTLTLDLAARVSTGSAMPDGDALEAAAGVLLLSAEDGVADTIRPRLEAAGADLARVHVFESVTGSDGTERAPEIPGDVDEIERLVEGHSVALVVVDPLMAFLGARVDSFRDQDVRRALHALKTVAERTDVAVVVVRHLTKSGGSHALYRGGGSIGIIGAARAGLLVAPDPSDEDRRILAVTKSNLAAMPPALAYRLVPDERHGVARVQWDGTTEHIARDLLDIPRSGDEINGDEMSASEQAIEFLNQLLADGPVATKELQSQAKDALISLSTLRRAKTERGVVARKEGGHFGKGRQRWVWALPEVGPTESGSDPEGDHGDPEDDHARARSPSGGHDHLQPERAEGVDRQSEGKQESEDVVHPDCDDPHERAVELVRRSFAADVVEVVENDGER
ncbi:MAG: AAA family ATPase [Actinomycetota bacterium]